MNRNLSSELTEFKLINKNGCEVVITNYGGKVMSIQVPDKNGKMGDIVPGYEKPSDYINGNPYFGAIIGRYANRIAKGKFRLHDKTYHLEQNNGENHLHGGKEGFHNQIWNTEKINNRTLKLNYTSADGEGNYPGNLNVEVIYTLTEDNSLRIDYTAKTDKATIINLTHHSFFNLKDAGKTGILDHELQINADYYTPVDKSLIPTGELRKAEGTPMDFTSLTAIGDRISNDYKQLKYGKGYDHNWILNKTDDSLTLAAIVFEPETGRKMEVWTTEPGLQFYSGNFLDGSDIGKDSTVYNYRSAFCLEAQHFPDSPNHPEFPSTLLKPGQVYKQTTIYKFLTGNK